MAGELAAKSPNSGAGDELMKLMRGLERDEILEVLAHGFCGNCNTLLLNRVQRIMNSMNIISFYF